MTPQKIASIILTFVAGILIGFIGYRFLMSSSYTGRTSETQNPGIQEEVLEEPGLPITTDPTPSDTDEPKRVAINWTGCSPKAIDIIEPEPGSAISFPLVLKVIVENGKRPDCPWTVFEAQAGTVVAKGPDGTIVARGIIQTEENWMTTGPVTFEAKIEALANVNPAAGPLTLVITEEDPSGMKEPQTISIPVTLASSSARCTLKPETGNCKAAITKYTFDPISGTCKTFIWGGCGGVAPFEDLEGCEAACVSP